MTEFKAIKKVNEGKPLLKVIGVGGGGSNAVNRMLTSGLEGVEFIVANTDLQDLAKSNAPHKLQLGVKCAAGLGAGSDPEKGREAAEEEKDAIREYLAGANMVFVTAGMGGGTGTGASPVTAEIARELKCLTVGVVTKPFSFEGKVRMNFCNKGIEELKKHVDTLIIIPNDNLKGLMGKNDGIEEAYALVDDVLRIAVQGISDVMFKPGHVNLDFADIQTTMSGKGRAIMTTGIGTGDNRATDAAKNAISSPLLKDCGVSGARNVLVNITGPRSLGLHEIEEAVNLITAKADDEVHVIYGNCFNDSMDDDKVEITVIATGFDEEVGNTDKPHLLSLNNQNPQLQSAKDKSTKPDNVVSIDQHQDKSSSKSGEIVYELNKDHLILEDIETQHQTPKSYDPPAGKGLGNNDKVGSETDVPTFLRRRNSRNTE